MLTPIVKAAIAAITIGVTVAAAITIMATFTDQMVLMLVTKLAATKKKKKAAALRNLSANTNANTLTVALVTTKIAAVGVTCTTQTTKTANNI